MSDAFVSLGYRSHAREVIRVLQCSLFSSNGGLPGGHQFEVVFPDGSPTVVLGPNGSGKSLCVAALQLTLGISEEDLRADLISAGVDQIEIDLTVHSQSARLRFDLQTKERTLHYGHPAESCNGAPELPDDLLQSLTGRLTNTDNQRRWAKLDAVNCLRGGEISFPLDRELLEFLRELASQPIRQELRDWETRLAALTGENEDGGRLASEREQWQVVQERVRYVEDLQVKLQQAHQFHADLQARMVQLMSQLSIVNAEHEEWNKLSSAADRARRIATWLDEIHREHEEVAWLREQHSVSQARLDELENAFRGAPENLLSILESYREAREAEILLDRKLTAAQAEIQRMDETIAAARRELDECAAPSPEQARNEQQALQSQLETAESELTTLLRERIELIRRREGMQMQLQQEYQLFRELDPAARNTLVSYLEWQGRAGARAEQRARAEARIQREHELTRIRVELQTGLAQFADLPPHAAEQVRELFDRRKLLATLNTDADEFVRRKESLEKRVKSSHKALWIATTGGVGAIVGGLAGGWDIALFSGLVASGLAIFVLKLFYSNAERELESVIQAGELIASRSTETSESIYRLQKTLQPLASFASADEALHALQRYQELCEKRDLLSAAAIRSSADDDERSTLEQFRLRLPAVLLAMPVEYLEQKLADCAVLESAFHETEREWQLFEEGGRNASRISALERQLADVKQRMRDAVAAGEQQLREHEVCRRELSERLTVLESVRAVERPPDEREFELAVLRERIAQLVAESEGFLERMEPEAMAEQLQTLSTLRAEIRKIRDSLSARQSLDELRARETLLTEELEAVKQKLTEMDPLYLLDGTVGDYAAKYSRQLSAAADAISSTEAEIDTLRRDLETVEVEHWSRLLSECEPMDHLQEQARSCEAQVQRTEHDVQVAKETIGHLRSELDVTERTHDQTVLSAVSERLMALTEGRCRGIQQSADRMSITMADGATRSLTSLSGGLADVVGIATRLAILDIAKDAFSMPVFWDEPFTRLDDRHLSRVQEAMVRLGETRQVVLLTRDSRLESWGSVVRMQFERTPVVEAVSA